MGEEEKFLRPASPDLVLRDPRTHNVLSAEGSLKPWIGPEGRYWRRRVLDGSCIIVEEPVAQKTFAKKVETPIQSQSSKISRDKEE